MRIPVLSKKHIFSAVLIFLLGSALKSDKSYANAESGNVSCATCSRTSDSLALVSFYNFTNGPGWDIKWDLSEPMESWFGVLIDPVGCVGILTLPNNNLSGFLPNINLPNLAIIDVSGNGLFGGIPPFTMANNLQIINLSGNFFTGFIPPFIDKIVLRSLNVSNNLLIGNIPYLGGMPNLEQIDIRNNMISGVLPDFSETPKLTELQLSGNIIGGELPDFILPNLRSLDVSHNNIFGNLPQLNQCISLEFLNLSNNNFTGNIPNFSLQSKLESLYLSHNNLFGPIPNFISLSKLKELWLNNNRLSGAVPNFFGMPSLEDLNLTSNLLESMPMLTNLGSLRNLRVPDNGFTFQDLIPNKNTPSDLFIYSPQDTVGVDRVEYFDVGQDVLLELDPSVEYPGNNYQWYKNGELFDLGNNPFLLLGDMGLSDKGDYFCIITNPELPQLQLVTARIILIFNGTSFNDKCEFAFDLTDSVSFCNEFFFFDAQPDAVEASCGLPDNIWFKFLAKGRNAFIFIDETTAEFLEISLWDFGNAPCVNGPSAVELQCGTSIEFEDLTVGKEYYFSVVGNGLLMNTLTLCLINSGGSTTIENDQPCNAKGISPTACLLGSTDFATPDVILPGCEEYSQATVWYKTRLSTGMNALTIDLDDNLFFNDVSIMVGRFAGECEDEFEPVPGGTFCGRAGFFQVTGLTSELDYWIRIGTSAVGGGAFILCLEESGRPLECGSNSNCDDGPDGPINIPIFTNGGQSCYMGCTTGAPPGYNQGDNSCFSFYHPTLWYKFTTDELASFLSLEITSSELFRPYFSLYKTTDCILFQNVFCKVEGNGRVKLERLPIDTKGTYYLAISDFYGRNGLFDICIETHPFTSVCNVDNEIKVTNTSKGSPLNGPYVPGEEVTFCYKVNTWQYVACNWIQAFIPSFGPCWDPVSFDANGQPAIIDKFLSPFGVGEWVWLNEGEANYNVSNPPFGLMPGDLLPAGWYFINQDSPVSPDDLNVNNSLGDGIRCAIDELSWEICFTLTTSLELNCSTTSNCNISMKTYTDGEVGGRDRAVCLGDTPTFFNSYLDCCNNPTLSTPMPQIICSGDTLSINFQANDPEVRFNVIASPEAGITGAVNGNFNSLFEQQLINETDQIASVSYTVIPEFEGCQGIPVLFEVAVYPTPAVSLAIDPSICHGESTQLTFNFTGEPPYNLTYTANGISQGNLSTDGSSVSTTVAPDSTTVYSATTLTGANGCMTELTDIEATLEIRPTSTFSIDTTICEGETYEFEGIEYDINGTYTFHYPDANEFACDSFTVINLTVGQVYQDSVTLRLCPGEVYSIGNNLFDETGNYVAVLPSVLGCDSIIFLDLIVATPILIVDSLIIHDQGTGNGVISITPAGGFAPYTYEWSNDATTPLIQNLPHGEYSVTVTDNLECQAIFTFIVDNVSSTNEIDIPGFRASLWPVPNQAGKQIFIGIETEFTGMIDFNLLNMAGVRIGNHKSFINRGKSQVTIGTPVIPGIYWVEIVLENGRRAMMKLLLY